MYDKQRTFFLPSLFSVFNYDHYHHYHIHLSPVIEYPHITPLSNHLSPQQPHIPLEHVTHILTTSLANHLLREKSIDGSVKIRVLDTVFYGY